MASNKANEMTVEQKLRSLYNLQAVYSDIDKICTLRGELPLEVEDLEDEVQGLHTRINNLEDELKHLSEATTAEKNKIKEAEAEIKKYESQQESVRNNREFDAIAKEIEFQNLEKELCDKHIKEYNAETKQKKQYLDEAKSRLKERQGDLDTKKGELDTIVAETQSEEDALNAKAKEIETTIDDDYLLSAFKRIRSGARNGLAVVSVERNACGGCFNKIPPQRQLDIRMHKKIIVCEYCGRILVDGSINEESAE